MKKISAFIVAVLAASMLTACRGTDTAEMTETSVKTEESITTVSEETAVSEETTSLIEETTDTVSETTETINETTTVETTVVTEIQSALSEDIYGLDSAKSIGELNRGTFPENNIPYLLWQSGSGDMSIYGVMTDEVINDYGDYKEYAEIVVISHDNKIETLECNWRGKAWGDPMEIIALNESQNAILGTFVNVTGTGALVEGAVLFSQNSSGNYELFTIDNEAILSDIRDRVDITLDNEQDVVTFSADGVEYTTETASINSYLQRLMSDDNIKVEREKILICDSYCIYSCDSDGKIIFTTEYRVADESVVTVDAEISFNNGEFTVEKIKNLYNEII